MDIITYALLSKRIKSIISGVSNVEVNGTNLIFEFLDGTSAIMKFPTPKDGVSVADIDVNADNQIVFTMSDGSEFISGKIPTVKGQDGVSPTITENADNTDKIYRLDIETVDGTFTTPNLKGADGQGGTGGSGEENIIDSISVNGINVTPDENKNVDITVPNIYVGNTEPIDDSIEVWINPNGESSPIEVPIEKIKVNGELQTPVNKVVDITVPDAYDDTALSQRVTNIESDYLKADDISGKVDKVDGKSLIADTEISRLASVDNYDDTEVKSQIQAVANGLMDSVGYSADYKTIDIIAKNGVKKSVNVAPIISHASITELSDVDTTNKATGKALVYNAITSKHEYADVSGTDEKVKMDSSTDAKYLGELLDNVTITNENGELKVKKLDGQEVTITEINYLKGLTMNVMDLVNMFSNGGVKIINTPVATYAELLTIDKSAFIEGISYLVYVLADENHDNAKTTYLVDKDSETPTYFGFADSQRDFTTNPIDLATEITGKLGISNMDSDAIKALFTVDDTYKTETAMNNAFSTHGAKALYDELLLAIGNKANDSDLTAHKDDTDIHVSTEDRTKWDFAKTHADSAHAPSNAQANVLETVNVNGTALKVSNKAVNIDLSGYAGNKGRITKETDFNTLTENAIYAVTSSAYAINAPTPLSAGILYVINSGIDPGRYIHQIYKTTTTDKIYSRISYNTGIDWREWKEITTTAEVDSIVDNKLNTLEYGDIAGGKNLVYKTIKNANIETNGTIITTTDATDIHVAKVKSGKTYTFTADSTVYAFYSVEPKLTIKSYDNSRVTSGSRTITIPSGVSYLAFRTLNTYTTPMVNEGSTSLPYEPYIPSVKMLADENAQQNTEAMDLKMLGWTVPSECPIQNYVDGNGVFHQRVGRVDLGTLGWSYSSEYKRFSTTGIKDYKKKESSSNTWVADAFLKDYSTTSGNNTASDSYNKSIGFNGTSNMFFVKNTSYTDATSFKNAMQGQYLYYELATEISMNVDGNEAITKVNESLGNYALKSLYSDTTINIGRSRNSRVGNYSIAEGGGVTASADFSHAEGHKTRASADSSHAEGYQTIASGKYSHAEGENVTASANSSHAEGYLTTASGPSSHAEGYLTTASADSSHAEGNRTTASGKSSHAEGFYTTADNLASHVSGKYNVVMTTGGDYGNTTGTAFVIGNGTSDSVLSNAFSVQFDGIVKAKSTITASTTADYAEFFEWLDKNPNEEDRVGHFVTLDGDKIKIATSEDDYILGIVSGEPFVLGNGDCDTWNGMYLHDEFRRTMYEPAPKMIKVKDKEIIEEEYIDEETKEVKTREVEIVVGHHYEEVEGEYEGTRPILNPDYDQTKQYISRFDRAEWSPVGMLGVLAVLHDGTAEVNGYVTVNNEGIATKCTRDTRNSYRVIKKVSDKVVEVIFR